MSSAHRGGGHMTGNSTATDTEAMQRVRYMAHMERRARPPTFRPLTIVVVVLSIGLFIIGLIMIVIAHWPGVSGGDSLKIAGGVLVAVGLKVFIIAMVTTCVLRNREQARFEKSMASIAVSRSILNLDPGVGRSMGSIHGARSMGSIHGARSMGSIHDNQMEMMPMRSDRAHRSRASTLASINALYNEEYERDTRTPFLDEQRR